jgi:SAM-dependent methyltransferase
MSDAGRRHEWNARHARRDAPGVPSPFVLAALDAIAARDAPHAPDTARRRRALDVACGAGRHALLLAARGYDVVALDWSHVAVAALGARGGGRIAGVVADATAWPFRDAAFDVVVVVDFLERAIVPLLRAAVAPLGALVMETFLRGQERHGHPRNPAYLLDAGELVRMCDAWTVLASYEGEVAAPVRACRAGIVAVRPAAR